MVWPITAAKSYVGEMGESMKAVELAAGKKGVGEQSGLLVAGVRHFISRGFRGGQRSDV
jgi:hypothetical protein